MNYNISVITMYVSGLILAAGGLGLYSGAITAGQLLFGVLFLALGLVSKTKYSVFKIIEARISVLIWVILSILTAFSTYLFGDTGAKTILWVSISVGLVNLFVILMTKVELEELALKK